MTTRREFLKKSALATAGAALAISNADALGRMLDTAKAPSFNINHAETADGRLHLRFFPYELKLRHTFTVATYSRTSTPDVQVELTYDGLTGYGEASMPQYLGQSVASVTAFLNKVDMEQFTDPFEMEDILGYVDSLSAGDTAAKAAVDIALHDLVGKIMGQPWYKIWGSMPGKHPLRPSPSASIRPTWCDKRQKNVRLSSTFSR